MQRFGTSRRMVGVRHRRRPYLIDGVNEKGSSSAGNEDGEKVSSLGLP